jgi:hypothetical protein
VVVTTTSSISIDSRLSRLDHRLLVGKELLGAFGWVQVEICLADQVGSGVAKVFNNGRIGDDEAALGVLYEQVIRNTIDQRAQEVFLGTWRKIGLRALIRATSTRTFSARSRRSPMRRAHVERLSYDA